MSQSGRLVLVVPQAGAVEDDVGGPAHRRLTEPSFGEQAEPRAAVWAPELMDGGLRGKEPGGCDALHGITGLAHHGLGLEGPRLLRRRRVLASWARLHAAHSHIRNG